ncbi:DUF885 domain-containing protein [Leucobacter aridicollis]|uniref:DUF885 domain-containing protein n=1 Tax=Leucobacter aridicollis TaxID=283878 RepID=UPI0021043CAC|nr:DUF885 domain-containing protein [Leucobacter aridicollis]UTX52693.1 DUF885 domain-containing protein [Leucobacter aridicollis]
MSIQQRVGAASGSRHVTEIDAVAERWLDTEVALDPVLGTKLGRSESATTFGDYSPEGAAHAAAEARAVLIELERATPLDRTDAVTARELRDRLDIQVARYEAGHVLRDLTVLETPAQLIRQAFDLMPRATEGDWTAIATRLAAVPAALAGYVQSLELGATRGNGPARRQVLAVAAQADRFAAEYFPGFGEAAAYEARTWPAAGRALATEVGAAAAGAARAYASFARYLRERLAPKTHTGDAVGRDNYALAARDFLGTEIDADECYEWALAEIHRIAGEQRLVAAEISPGASPAQAIALLDEDPGRIVHGEAALQRWLQERSDEAIEALDGPVFAIPSELRRLDCRIAPTREGGIYYTAPSDDFGRPGSMWWTVPAGVTEFRTWRELTTVYHEGVPGHHLQLGGAVARRDTLNAWRRTRAGSSGHLEGWALYAERLMVELGFLEDPGARLGMLDAQRMRAARVVVDIGLHLGKRAPDGGVWTAERVYEFMANNVTMRPEALRFEVLRYLGWPGQASSYKLGERLWLGLRAEAEREPGFTLASFHDRALSLGTLGLDTLQWAMRR